MAQALALARPNSPGLSLGLGPRHDLGQWPGSRRNLGPAAAACLGPGPSPSPGLGPGLGPDPWPMPWPSPDPGLNHGPYLTPNPSLGPDSGTTTQGCSPHHTGLQPPPHRVAAPTTTHGCSPHHTGLQPSPHRVAAPTTQGCSPHHTGLQPSPYRVVAIILCYPDNDPNPDPQNILGRSNATRAAR